MHLDVKYKQAIKVISSLNDDIWLIIFALLSVVSFKILTVLVTYSLDKSYLVNYINYLIIYYYEDRDLCKAGMY